MMPLVSICMPAYNAAKYLDQTINSVLKQSYKNIELIICNDGSNDDTGKVLSKYETYTNIKVLKTANLGQCAAANEAFRHAKGEYIKFFDADDLMNTEHISEQVKRLSTDLNCIVSGQIKRFYNDDIITALHEPLANWEDLEPIEWLVNENGHGLGMMQCGMFLIPRHFIDTGGIWNESLSQINDFEFFPRILLQARKILFTENAKVFYRSGLMDSLSNDLSKEKLISAHTALLLTTNRLLQYETSERVKSALSTFWHLWKYHFFLNAPELYKSSQVQLNRLGNHKDSYHQKNGGLVMRLIGWKNYKRLKLVFAKSSFLGTSSRP